MPQENPYQEPDRAGDASHKSHFDLRAELETVVAVLATMLVAGGWAGAPYQPRSFILVLVLATAVSLLGMLGYAATTKRARILRFLPLVIIAVFGQELLAGLFALVGFLGVPIGVLFSLIRPTRQNWLVVGHLVLAVAAAMLSVFLYAQLQSLGARKAADHGEIIIHAIRNYEAEVGELPSSLADLVPRELDSIPGTGMTGFPSFVYRDTRTETGESERLFASYELRVNLYKLLQFDCLVYWPEGNYPDSMYGGGVERIRAWAYVHE